MVGNKWEQLTTFMPNISPWAEIGTKYKGEEVSVCWVPLFGSCWARSFIYTVLQSLHQPRNVGVHYTEGNTESQRSALGFVPAAGKCQNQHSSPGLSGLKSGTTLLNFAHLHCFSPTGEELYETYGVLWELNDNIPINLGKGLAHIKLPRKC